MVTNTYLIISGIIVLIAMFFVTIAVVLKHQNTEKRKTMIDHFDIYVGILQFHMEKAYEIIHKDQILIYSLEATGIPDDKFKYASESFGKLTIKMMGPMIYDELQYLYGGDEALLFNIIEFFNTKYETDEIRSTAIENLTLDEEEIKWV